jgi:hypothetical protein
MLKNVNKKLRFSPRLDFHGAARGSPKRNETRAIKLKEKLFDVSISSLAVALDCFG